MSAHRTLLALLLAGTPALAQTEPTPAPTPAVEPTPVVSRTPAPQSAAPRPTPEPVEPGGEGVIPRLNLYLPEGRVDFRLAKLIKSSLFETQFQYDFVSGDLAAALRYRYYGVAQTLTLSGFDQLNFRSLESSSLDYDRIRGLNALIKRPLSFEKRFLYLAEMDRLTFLTPGNPDNRRTNVFLKIGYQVGTGEDYRSNQLGGDPTDRIQNLFTVFRNLGPNGRVVTVAVTYGTPVGSFNYVKAEGEAVQVLDFPGNKRIVGRVHAGFFPYKPYGPPEESSAGKPYRIPSYELFQLDGRGALKGSRSGDRDVNEIHLTLEGFYPVFINKNEQFLRVSWTTLYLVGYVGTGNLGDRGRSYTQLGDYKQDAGLGFEASFAYFRYRVFISALAARVFQETGSPKFLLTLRSVN